MTPDLRLRHESILRPGIDPAGGYTFCDELSAAIATVVDRSDLDFDGLALGPAVQRALFIDLVNRPALYDAFMGGTARVPVANRLEGDVVSTLLPEAKVDWAGRGPLQQAAADVRRVAHRLQVESSGDGPVVVVALTEKFRRFVEPMGPAGRTIVSALSGPVPVRAPRALRAYPGILAFARALESLVRTRRPRVLVAVEGNAPADAVTGAVARRDGVPSVVVQQGWSPQVHAGFRGLPFDTMLVWGDGFADILRPFNTELTFRSVGNHAIEQRPESSSSDDPVGVFLQSTSHLIAPEHLEGLVEVVEILRRAFPRVLVREHPSAPLAEALQARLGDVELANAPLPLAQVLGKCRAAVSIYSTTLFEAVAAGALPVSYNPTSLPALLPSLASEGVGYEVSAPHEVAAAVETGSVDSTAQRRFIARYFPYLGAEAARRSTEAIEEIAQEAS